MKVKSGGNVSGGNFRRLGDQNKTIWEIICY